MRQPRLKRNLQKSSLNQNKNIPKSGMFLYQKPIAPLTKALMNKRNNFQPRKGIENATLIYVSIFMLAGISLLAHQLFFSGNKAGEWLSLQTSVLGKSLSGQVLGVFDSKPDLPKSIQLPIFMYHHVGPIPPGAENDQLRKNLTVSPEDFEMQVAWLKARGFNTVTLNDLYLYTVGEYQLPSNPIILTFDDGYKDVFQYAVPTLKKYGYTGSFAVITQFSGIKYGTNEYATWDEIRKARKEGMEVVSHTQDHFDGASEHIDKNFMLRNLKDSQADIQANLGIKPIPVLIYPYGHYSPEYISQAEKAGFKLGLTTEHGKTIKIDRLMEIPRLRVSGGQALDSFEKMVLE
jgi:peptidoglycan/xylan/chitin deacetylase (PgdA/CDA1 family)